MKKKLVTDLKSLAHDILQLEEGQNMDSLRKSILEIYEKLSVLDYLDKNSLTTTESRIDEHRDIESMDEKQLDNNIEPILHQERIIEPIQREKEESIIPSEPIEVKEEINEKSEEIEDLFEPTFDLIKDDFSQKEEFKDTVSLDDTENMFETKKEEKKQLSLNDKLLKSSIQIGLNDRIAFVNKLFNYSQSDFNKVLSILNGFKTEVEAKNYIQNTLKVKYNWTGKEEIEERFLLIVERKFL